MGEQYKLIHKYFNGKACVYKRLVLSVCVNKFKKGVVLCVYYNGKIENEHYVSFEMLESFTLWSSSTQPKFKMLNSCSKVFQYFFAIIIQCQDGWIIEMDINVLHIKITAKIFWRKVVKVLSHSVIDSRMIIYISIKLAWYD